MFYSSIERKIKTMSFIDFHTHQSDAAQKNVAIRNVIVGKELPFTKGFFSAGIHPWYIEEEKIEEYFLLLEKYLKEKNCCCLGEAGLDKLVKTPFSTQETVFIRQIRLAEKYKKPIIVHCVKAFSELIRIKKNMNPSIPMIVHGFNNNLNIHTDLLQNGFYFSFGAAILLEKTNASKALITTPISRIFLETDNAICSISSVYEKVAILLNMSESDLCAQIAANYNKIMIC